MKKAQERKINLPCYRKYCLFLSFFPSFFLFTLLPVDFEINSITFLQKRKIFMPINHLYSCLLNLKLYLLNIRTGVIALKFSD